MNGLPLSLSSPASPDVDGHTSKGGGGNKLSMRNEKQRRERESERGRDGGAVLFCSVL